MDQAEGREQDYTHDQAKPDPQQGGQEDHQGGSQEKADEAGVDQTVEESQPKAEQEQVQPRIEADESKQAIAQDSDNPTAKQHADQPQELAENTEETQGQQDQDGQDRGGDQAVQGAQGQNQQKEGVHNLQQAQEHKYLDTQQTQVAELGLGQAQPAQGLIIAQEHKIPAIADSKISPVRELESELKEQKELLVKEVTSFIDHPAASLTPATYNLPAATPQEKQEQLDAYAEEQAVIKKSILQPSKEPATVDKKVKSKEPRQNRPEGNNDNYKCQVF